MPLIILLLLILFPALEIAVFIEVGSQIGTWPTVAAIFLTAVVGTAIVRAQGLAVLGRARLNLQSNRFPVKEAFDGICLVIAGLLLLTPGFITDGLGGLLLVPMLRDGLRRFLLGRLDVRGPGSGGSPGGGPRGHWIIEGEYEVVDKETEPQDRLGPTGRD